MKLLLVLTVVCNLFSPNEARIEWWSPSYPCPSDLRFCLNGKLQFRLPELNCEFPPCDSLSCTADVFVCCGGHVLYRDPQLNCQFPPCPPMVCTLDLKICPDGTVLGRDPYDCCRFPKCPNMVLDIRHCDNAIDVYTLRNPDNQFKFYPCPGQCPSCNATGQICDNATSCRRGSYCEYGYPQGNPKFDGKGWCCPNTIPCDNDTKRCPDGSVLNRDPRNDCEFPMCQGECPNNRKNSGYCSRNNSCNYEHYCFYPTTYATAASQRGWCCPSEFWEKLCDIERHLLKNWINFLKIHKKLVDVAPKKQAKVRIEVDKIYGLIDCINHLLCEIREKKKEIEDGQIYRNSISTILCFSNWTREIAEKAYGIEESIKKLRQWMRKAKHVKVLNELEELKATGLLEAITGPVDMLWNLGLYAMETLIPIYAKEILDFTPICQKAVDLGLIYHELIGHVKDLQFFLKKLYGDHVGALPAWWFNDLTQCVYEFAKVYYELRDCCGNIAQGKITDEDILKKLSPWLKRAMDLRERFRDCFPKRQSRLNSEILKVDPDNDTHMENTKLFIDDLEDRFTPNLKIFDDCIIKIRCLFLDLVEEMWNPALTETYMYFATTSVGIIE